MFISSVVKFFIKNSPENVMKNSGTNENAKMQGVHNVIKPLYYMSRCMCIWPYKYNKHNKIVPLTIKDRVLGYLLIAGIITVFSWSIYQRILAIHVYFTITSVTGAIFNLFQHTLVVCSLMIANSNNYDLTQKFFVQLDEINQNGLFSIILYDGQRSLLKQMTAFLLSCMVINILDIVLYGDLLNYSEIASSLSTYVVQTIMFLIFFQIICKLQLLIKYSRHLNRKLEASNLDELKIHAQLFKINTTLCDLIKIVNDIHGEQILLMFCSIMAFNLNSLYMCVRLGYSEAYLTIISITTLVLKEICYILFYSGLLVTLATKCTTAKNEVIRTGMIAGDKLQDMHLGNRIELLSNKEHYQFFMHQLLIRNPHFSAAGVLPMDRTIIATMFAAVTSYFMILLQFQEPHLFANDNQSTFNQSTQ